MLVWLSINGSTIIITLILFVLVVLAGRKITKRKGGCGCGHCCGCCDQCYFHTAKEEDEKKD